MPEIKQVFAVDNPLNKYKPIIFGLGEDNMIYTYNEITLEWEKYVSSGASSYNL
jgi:hypothetical protein